jgi:vanillate O-demethylase ferredoxin subunit
MRAAPDRLRLRVRSLTWEAEGVLSIELRAAAGGDLPPQAAGAHLDLHLPNGMVRSYSLLNPGEERQRYVIGVGLDRASRGGSAWLHAQLRPGQVLEAAAPRNNFALAEDAAEVVLIAGGIGITPLLAMAERRAALGRPWRLHYAVRSRAGAAFLDRLAALPHGELLLHVDEEEGGALLDLRAAIAAAPVGAHLYCCGPAPMLAAFEAAAAGRPPGLLHVERFTAAAAPVTPGGYTVRLAKSGRELPVAPGQTILEALEAAGFEPPHSCRGGVCGACETRVIEGLPLHRDSILTEAERKAGRTMMICCSGAKGKLLVLDL